jgi:hypothetical protein
MDQQSWVVNRGPQDHTESPHHVTVTLWPDLPRSSFKDASNIGLSPTHITQLSFRRPYLKMQSNSEALRVGTLTYEFGKGHD